MPSREKILLIGGRGGIGSALAQQLRARGHDVLVTSRHPGHDTHTLQLDLESSTLRQALARILNRHPDISTVIHCAGVNHLAAFDQLDDADIGRLLQVNLVSAMAIAAVFGERFRQRGRGALLFVGSTLGSIGMPGYSAYSASKFALRGFAEALKRELHSEGVSVLFVAPRATRTSMNSENANALNQALGNNVDDPDKVARQLVVAWEQKRARTWLGLPERLFVVLNALFPSLVDKALARQAQTVRTYLNNGETS